MREIRELIGSYPLIMVGAGALILDERGRILLQLRTDNGMWGIPGGAMEPGETTEETARREILEETGLTVGEMTLFGAFSGPELFYVYPNGDQVHNVSIVYLTEDYEGALRPDEEGAELRFFGAEELPDAISPSVRPILRQFRESLKISRK